MIMDKVTGWICTQAVGFSIINPKSCFRVSGSPENIRKLLLYIRDNFPEQLDQELIDELDKGE
jgi:hypothetical protein